MLPTGTVLQPASGLWRQLARRCLATDSTARVENVLIIGAGFMGTGIAQACAIPGRFKSITVQDKSDEQLDRARANIIASLTRLKAKKRVAITDPEEIASRIQLTKETKPVGSDSNLLIIEAISEVLEWKQVLFAELAAQYRDNCTVLFTTNTSSLRCSDVGTRLDEATKRRFAGLHFLDAILSPLVEIARTSSTADATLTTLKQFAADIDKRGIICPDMAGLIANRLQIPLMREALRMLERGDATVEDIDAALKLGYGNPLGPFELFDFIGLDVIQLVMQQWTVTDEGGVVQSRALEQLIKAGHLGRKTGRGFYDYSKPRETK